VGLFFSLWLLGKDSVNKFPRGQGNIGGVVFYVVRVVSKESRLFVLPELLVITYNKSDSNFFYTFLHENCR
jgi:hypothetical protein